MALSTRFRLADDVRRREQPHAVDQPDQMLLVAAQHDVVVRIGAQQHFDALSRKSA